MRPVTVWLILLAAAVLLTDPAWAIERHCTHATVMCARKLGYNYQECGSLSADKGRTAIEYATCYDWEENHCAPCDFGSVMGTSNVCQRVFGPTCNYYFLQNHRFEEVTVERIESEIESWDLEAPDASPLWEWMDDIDLGIDLDFDLGIDWDDLDFGLFDDEPAGGP